VLLGVALYLAAPLPSSAHAQSGDDARPVLSVRELTLKPGASAQEFEKHFAEIVGPWFEQRIPGVRAYLARGERGDRTNAYLLLYEFDTLARRNEYFPQPGVQSERFKQLAGVIPDFGLDKYTDYAGEYTDYVALKP
ncbi:MAG TPA: hypothetical protein VMM83_08210, partial [Longimicrobiales bacterium]|nr:hypothetical protein [Longimicrobiales bacterium]